MDVFVSDHDTLAREAMPLLGASEHLPIHQNTPRGREFLVSHRNLYNTSLKRVFTVLGIATVAGLNDYYPSFQPDLPIYTKVVTLITSSLLCIGDFSGLMTTLLGLGSWRTLQENANKLKQRAHYCASLVLLDTIVGLASTVFALLACSSGFANSVDGGSPRVLATTMWLLHSLSLTYRLYLFALKIQKKTTKYLAKLFPSSTFSLSLSYKAELRHNYADLIDRIEFKSSNQTRDMVRFPLSLQPPIFNARSLAEVSQYANDILSRDRMEVGRANKERFIIKCIKGFLYVFIVWVCLLYTSTQMGSIHSALQDYIIPTPLRRVYQGMSATAQENVISIALVALFIQSLDHGIAAVDSLILQLVRTWGEVFHLRDCGRTLRHLAVLVCSGFLGGLSFSFAYFSAQNGMGNIDFKASYETYLPTLASQIVKTIGGLNYLGINLRVPPLTSSFTILVNTTSLIELLNRFKNYILGGGRLLPLFCRSYSVPRISGYDFLFKLEFLSFLKAAYRAIDSRYYSPQSLEATGVPAEQEPGGHAFPLSSAMKDHGVLFKHYYTRAMAERGRDTDSLDSLVDDAPAHHPIRGRSRSARRSVGSDETDSSDEGEDFRFAFY